MTDMRNDILNLIGRDGPLKKAAGTDGGEYAGPCPFCKDGEDRFRVWPTPAQGKPRYWCRQCGKRGDAIQYLRDHDHLSYAEALEQLGLQPKNAPVAVHPQLAEPVEAPFPAWQAAAAPFVATCINALWSTPEPTALEWLRRRNFTDERIRAALLGYNDADTYQDRAAWGLPPETNREGHQKKVWLPRGIVIPWQIDGAFWRVNIRRPPQEIADGGPKYIGPPGSANGLYGADALAPGHPALLVEGEFDALSVAQYAGDLVTPVATGSTSGARRVRWAGKLALASAVLVAFDDDKAGEEAAAYWCNLLPRAVRWRPYWGKDANGMAQTGGDIRGWVTSGLAYAGSMKGKR
jgi:DNA primase